MGSVATFAEAWLWPSPPMPHATTPNRQEMQRLLNDRRDAASKLSARLEFHESGVTKA